MNKGVDHYVVVWQRSNIEQVSVILLIIFWQSNDQTCTNCSLIVDTQPTLDCHLMEALNDKLGCQLSFVDTPYKTQEKKKVR